MEKRIPSLDGLRAISILLVIVGHLFVGKNITFRDSPLLIIVGNGLLGVTIFFVISGFLITSLLLREHETRGQISLQNFYIRRILRIFPPFYAYVAVLGLLTAAGWVFLSHWDFLSAVTFTVDYSPKHNAWPIQHAWSLSVEEQFYLLWPALLVLCIHRWGRLAAAKVACALIVVSPLLRELTHLYGGSHFANRIPYMLHTRIDSLMFGCLAALLSGTELLEGIYKCGARIVWLLPAFVFVASPVLEDRFGGTYTYIVGHSLEGACIAVTMLWLVRNSHSVVGKILNSRPMIHLGVISYSVYLWQQVFLPGGNTAIGRFPANVICVGIVSELSYYVVEKRFLKWRKYFAAAPRVAPGPAATAITLGAGD